MTNLPTLTKIQLQDTLAIVNCKASKQDYPCRAEEMYDRSAQFRAQRDLIKRVYPHYAILSAEYGLVRPNTIIEPYDVSIYEKATARLSSSGEMKLSKKLWAEKVRDQLSSLPYKKIHFHISNAYWGPLLKQENYIHITQQVNPGLVILRYKEALEVFETTGVLDTSILTQHRKSADPEVQKYWYHPLHEPLFGYARDVSKKYGVDEGNLCRVSRGLAKQTRGWVIDDSLLPYLEEHDGSWKLQKTMTLTN